MPVIPAPKERRQENQELKATSSTHQVCGQLESGEREGDTLSLLLLEISQFILSTSRAGTPGLQDPPPCESFPAWVFSALVFTPRRSDTFELLEKHYVQSTEFRKENMEPSQGIELLLILAQVQLQPSQDEKILPRNTEAGGGGGGVTSQTWDSGGKKIKFN